MTDRDSDSHKRKRHVHRPSPNPDPRAGYPHSYTHNLVALQSSSSRSSVVYPSSQGVPHHHPTSTSDGTATTGSPDPRAASFDRHARPLNPPSEYIPPHGPTSTSNNFRTTAVSPESRTSGFDPYDHIRLPQTLHLQRPTTSSDSVRTTAVMTQVSRDSHAHRQTSHLNPAMSQAAPLVPNQNSPYTPNQHFSPQAFSSLPSISMTRTAQISPHNASPERPFNSRDTTGSMFFESQYRSVSSPTLQVPPAITSTTPFFARAPFSPGRAAFGPDSASVSSSPSPLRRHCPSLGPVEEVDGLHLSSPTLPPSDRKRAPSSTDLPSGNNVLPPPEDVYSDIKVDDTIPEWDHMYAPWSKMGTTYTILDWMLNVSSNDWLSKSSVALIVAQEALQPFKGVLAVEKDCSPDHSHILCCTFYAVGPSRAIVTQHNTYVGVREGKQDLRVQESFNGATDQTIAYVDGLHGENVWSGGTNSSAPFPLGPGLRDKSASGLAEHASEHGAIPPGMYADTRAVCNLCFDATERLHIFRGGQPSAENAYRYVSVDRPPNLIPRDFETDAHLANERIRQNCGRIFFVLLEAAYEATSIDLWRLQADADRLAIDSPDRIKFEEHISIAIDMQIAFDGAQKRFKASIEQHKRGMLEDADRLAEEAWLEASKCTTFAQRDIQYRRSFSNLYETYEEEMKSRPARQ